MKVIAITGRKGGVGKTTLSGNLAVELLARGLRVLLLDADPQQSSVAWGRLGEGALSHIVRPIDSSNAATFKRDVEKAKTQADRVLIDTPPGFAEPALLAMAVADLVLLPCGPSPLDLLPTREAVALARQAQQARGGHAPKLALVPSKVARTKLSAELAASLEGLGELVLPGIGFRSIVAEAALVGFSAREAAPRSAAAIEFSTLTEAIEEQLK